MDKNYLIEHMSRKEVDVAIEWAAREGWNPGIHDAQCFFAADPRGFFAGKLNGALIAMGSAVVYDDHFAFCGFYMVDERYRSEGYGLLLTKERLAYVGTRNAGIDGVINMLEKYTRIGYQFAHNNARYLLQENHPVQNQKKCIPLSQIPFDRIAAYDRLHFPASREAFLKCWINQPNSLALGYTEDNELKGYGLIRTCQHGYKIAPLFANTPEIAGYLFNELIPYAQGGSVYLDIPENNPAAINLVQSYNMTKVFATARMYLKEEPKLPMHEIFGITSFELG